MFGGVDVVFERDRDAVQRAAQSSLRALAIELVGLLERVRVDGDRRVNPVLVHRQAHEVRASTSSRDVRRFSSIALRMSAIVASTMLKDGAVV